MTTERLTLTPSQTVGPFLHIALADPTQRFAVAEDSPGAIRVFGTVTDGAGAPIPDALVETWQADGLFTRCPTDGDGRYEIFTRKPPVAATVDGTPQAPHVSVSVFARGLLDRVVTRIYFPDEDAANSADPTLLAVPADRRHLLVAAAQEPAQYRFDIALQGDGEGVFLAI
jgi:protocatechuate 3,4-dioxygenase alpha subunit